MVRHTRKVKHTEHRISERMNTMKGLHGWYTAKYEKLGWMVLAKAQGHDSKVAEYKRGIDRLLASIKHVMGEYRDPDRIHDLNVLHIKTMVLRDFVHKHL